MFNNRIHDFISLYGAQAFVEYNLNLYLNYDYISFIKNISHGLLDSLNVFDDNGDEIVSSSVVVNADIVNGVWSALCSKCHQRVVIRRSNSLFVCVNCFYTTNVSLFSRVFCREDCYSVENILLCRPSIKNRNAYSFETLEMLLQENKENL